MGHRFRHLVAIAGLAILAACGGVPDGSVVPTPPPATAALTALPPSRSAPQLPMATVAPLPAVTPASIPAATSAVPAALPTNLPPSPDVRAPQTATPTFPETRITEQTLPALRLLRTIGFGTVRQARITPDNRLLAVATTAGVALFELPSLRHLRFDPIDDGAYALTLSDEWRYQRAASAIDLEHCV